jgi:uncharacterized repeat protein (TIGR01451 family)
VADLAVTLAADQTVAQGGPITYTVSVTNIGPGAVTGATLSDSVPLAVTHVTWLCHASAGSACGLGGSGQTLAGTLDLLSGGTATYTIMGVIAPAAQGVVANTVGVALPAGAVDPVPGNNHATVTTVIVIIPVTGQQALYLPLVRR